MNLRRGIKKLAFHALLRLVNVISLLSLPLQWAKRHGLARGSRNFIGKELTLEPHYGWGWASCGPEQRYVDTPPPLRFRMHGLVKRGWRTIGVYGEVTTEQHPLSGHWIEVRMRHRRRARLDERDVHYVVVVWSSQPVPANGGMRSVTGEPCACSGWGEVYCESTSGERGC